MHVAAASTISLDLFMANALVDRELRRVRRIATMLHDHRSVAELVAYERELEEQLNRTNLVNDLLDASLRQLRCS
jgi:hypothetical protein